MIEYLQDTANKIAALPSSHKRGELWLALEWMDKALSWLGYENPGQFEADNAARCITFAAHRLADLCEKEMGTYH